LSNKKYQILHKKKHVFGGQCSIDEHRKRLPSKFTAQITNEAKLRNWEEIARCRQKEPHEKAIIVSTHDNQQRNRFKKICDRESYINFP